MKPTVKTLRSALLVGVAAGVLILFAGGASAGEGPSNEELYQMILQLEANQERLRESAEKAKAGAAAAEAELERTQQQLDATRQALEQTQGVVNAQQEVLTETRRELGTAPSGSVVKIPDTPGGYKATVEVIAMRPGTSELDYAISDPQDTANPVVVGPNAKVLSVDTGYEPGFRVGLSRDFAGTGVDAKVVYTRLHTSFTDRAVAPDGGVLVATLVHKPDKIEALIADARFDFDYDVVDLEVGQTFQAGGSHVDVRIFGGARFASIDQEIRATYQGQDFDGGDADRTEVIMDVDLTGVGPRIGAGAAWDVGSGFSVFGHTAASLLVADIDASTFEKRVGAKVRLDIGQDFEPRVIPVAELSLGLGWTRHYSELSALTLEAGYQVENWFNVVDPLMIDATSKRAHLDKNTATDLSLDGFFVRGIWRF